ncbi:MAG: tRNA pseudouridine(55) synthase TruB [Anaerolineales bacterium]
MIGVLNINKPIRKSSHDVVQAVRRIMDIRRVGHTGTLDPLATGVLVILVGPATRLTQFIVGADKAYHAVIRLGVTTTTYDEEGEITSRAPASIMDNVDRAAIEAALSAFEGEIAQAPPMYSAVRVQGRRLYELAREGQDVERAPRSVTIYQLEIASYEPPDLTLDLRCSSGTYVRSLAHDLGQTLGCGAYLRALTRTAVGPFRLEESYTLDQLHALAQEQRLDEALHPPRAALYDMPSVQLTPAQERAVRYGQSIALPPTPERVEASHLQAEDAEGRLVAVLIPVEEGRWRPTLVLPEHD